MVHAFMAITLAFTLLVLPDTFLTLLIVNATLVRVRECFIGVGNLLELSLCSLWVVLILVRMEFDSKFLESLLDFGFRRVSADTHNFVIVFTFWCLLLFLLLLSLLATTLLLVMETLRLDHRSTCLTL